MLKIAKIDHAIQEAKRFIQAAEKAKRRLSDDKFAVFGSRETGAARRASLDLTRALAEMRKSN